MANQGYDGRYHSLGDADMMAYPRTHVYDDERAAYRARQRQLDEEQKRMAREREYNTRITAQTEAEMQDHEAKEAKKKKHLVAKAADEDIYYLLS